MPTGKLQIITNVAQQAYSLANVMIRVYKNINGETVFEDYLISDQEGKTEILHLPAPDKMLSYEEQNTLRPYEVYNIEASLAGYESILIQGVQIFADTLSIQELSFTPLKQVPRSLNTTTIPDHHLLTNSGNNTQQPNCGKNCNMINNFQINTASSPYLLNAVVIPRTIRVHLGRPSSNAENVTVDFIYYIKNVCSSEVYPTWPREALLANIHAQTSLALNRIYTEWYRSKGYNFDITNNTAFDQAFVKNRNIFESVSILVDEVFNQFLRKRNFAEPYYAEYCDGRIAQCPGMKQWGTLNLANQGYRAIQILQYYYGNDVRLISTNRIEDVSESYSGTPLRLGSSGKEVYLIQQQLNAIAVNYPNITPIYPLDGIYGTNSEAAVKVFQKQFNLTVDGIVGKATWYKINYIYLAVLKLAELTSLGRIENDRSGEYPGIVLKEGDKGVAVQQLQFYLSSISTFDPAISPINSIDSHFGKQTYQAVISFQNKYGLNVDGEVGRNTWDAIYQIYSNINNIILPDNLAPAYPGMAIKEGASGNEVFAIQEALNSVSQEYPNIPVVIEDGFFGPATKIAIQRFQDSFELEADGIVGPLTWKKLFEIAYDIENGNKPSLSYPPFPGIILQNGSQGSEVTFIQERLRFISIYYKNIPTIQVDGIYGPATTSAVNAFQKMLGLDVDGKVGNQTWQKINEVYYELNQQ